MVRIPLTEKPTLRKLVQVALNAGQSLGRPTPDASLSPSHFRCAWYVGLETRRTKLSDVMPEASLAAVMRLLEGDVRTEV